MLGEIADLAEPFAAMRPQLESAALELIVEIEEEQPHRLAERRGRDHQHQPFDAQRREADRAGRAPATSAATASAGMIGQPPSTVSMPAT